MLPAILLSTNVPAHGHARPSAFFVSADIDPGTLPRVLELFAKRGLTPDSIHADCREGVLAIDISLSGMDADLAAYIGRCLREIYVVREVESGNLIAWHRAIKPRSVP